MAHKEEHEEDILEEKWSLKRIGIAAVSGLLLLVMGILFVRAVVQNDPGASNKTILGSSDENLEEKTPAKINAQEDIGRIIAETKESIEKLTTENITSSEAAIGKIIYDLQQLQGGKKDTQDILCEMVCKK